jgi:uroporphyrinogen decarboxylase
MRDRFLRACRRRSVDRTPIWLMRQAGRYMPEYRAVRERYGFLQMVKTPEVAAEVTLQPVKALGVDAAIIFADILPPLEGLGLQLTYEKGEGPVIHNPIRHPREVAALRSCDPRETVAYTLKALQLVKRELNGLPLIGFSGAPFTLASYAIEGGGSREYRLTKRFMYEQPAAWHDLMQRLSQLVAEYLIAQVEAGADAVQIFDSWAGALAPADYRSYVLQHTKAVIQTVRQRLGDAAPPIIYFGTDMAGLAGELRQIGADVLGVDWRIDIDTAWAQYGSEHAVQGNLDPMTLFAPLSIIAARAREILQRVGGRPGHIFNLGHGILTETPVDHVRYLVEFVQSFPISETMPALQEVTQ